MYKYRDRPEEREPGAEKMLGSGREGPPAAQLGTPMVQGRGRGTRWRRKYRGGLHCAGLCVVPVKLDGLPHGGIATGRVSTAHKTPSDVALPPTQLLWCSTGEKKRKGRGPFRRVGSLHIGLPFCCEDAAHQVSFSRDPDNSSSRFNVPLATPPECISITCASTWCCRDDTGSINLQSDSVEEAFKGQARRTTRHGKGAMPCSGRMGLGRPISRLHYSMGAVC